MKESKHAEYLCWNLCKSTFSENTVVFVCVFVCSVCLCVCLCCACTAVPACVKRRVAEAADTQDRYLSGIRTVRFMAICSESVHPLAIMEWLEEKVKLRVQQKSIRLSRTIQPFPLRGVLAPNLCLLALLHSSQSDSPLSLQTTCNVAIVLHEKIRLEWYEDCEMWSCSNWPKAVI